jgi:hypothetical protein
VILNNFISHFLLHIAEETEIAHAAAGYGWLRVGLLHAKHRMKRFQMAVSQGLFSLTKPPYCSQVGRELERLTSGYCGGGE